MNRGRAIEYMKSLIIIGVGIAVWGLVLGFLLAIYLLLLGVTGHCS